MSEETAVGLAEAEELLSSAAFLDCRSLWHSSNYVYLARLCGPGGEPFAAIYKPLAGESPLWDFPEGLYRREVAAYQYARLLGWNFIPPTVVREGPEGVGSLQLFVSHDPQAHFFVQRENPELVPQLQRMAVFDALTNNADRKGGHCLLDPEGRIWGIDHGLCFHPQYKLRSVIWDWAGEPIPAGWLAEVATATEALKAGKGAAEALASLLSPGELDALVARSRTLLATRRFPTPGEQRHYPWPLV